MEIYGFEKLGSHHQLLIWDRKDSGRYHHKIPLSNCFSSLSFCLMPNFPMTGNQHGEGQLSGQTWDMLLTRSQPPLSALSVILSRILSPFFGPLKIPSVAFIRLKSPAEQYESGVRGPSKGEL